MADDPNPALRAELTDALAVVASQVRGLNGLATSSISADLAAEVTKQITARTHRRDLITNVIQKLDDALRALNTLQADGYPELLTAPISAALLNELRGEEDDLEAGIGVFAPALAATAKITFGQPETTPEPITQGA